jgi:hypothetical protein
VEFDGSFIGFDWYLLDLIGIIHVDWICLSLIDSVLEKS